MKSGQHFVCLLWVGNHCQTHFFLCQKSTAHGDWWLCTLIGHNKDQSHPVHPVCPPLSWDTAILETKCMYSRSAVRKNNTFASRSSAWLKTQFWYWGTRTWDGRRPWTSAPPASPTPACKNDNCQSTTRKYDMGERNSAEIMKKRTVDFDDWMERENHHIKITNSRPGWGFGFLLCCQHLFRYSRVTKS